MYTAIPITDASDPRIEDYTCVRERDLTGRDGRFIVEGKVTLDVFLSRSRMPPKSLFLAETRLTVLDPLLQTLPGTVPVYTASQSVMDEVAGFPIHRGILACGEKLPRPELRDWLSGLADADTLVVCIGLSNHDNAGSVFRNAAALGASAVLLDQTSCDPLYRKSIRVSAGTSLWMPFYHGGSAHDLFAAIASAGYDIWTLTPRSDAAQLYQMPRPRRLAIVLGPEGPGLDDDLMSLGQPVRIAMANEVDSLNVATSLAIALSVRFAG